MIPPDYEKGIRRAFLQVLVLCLCAVVPPLFSLTGIFRPEDEPLGQWFQRSGSVMTAFAVFAHFKAGGIATMIAGGTFAETWEAYHKYNRFQALAVRRRRQVTRDRTESSTLPRTTNRSAANEKSA